VIFLSDGHPTMGDTSTEGILSRVRQIVAQGTQVNVMGYGYRVEELRAKGAPIDWYADEPVSITGAVGSLSRRAPHPEAGKLFMDFVPRHKPWFDLCRPGVPMFRRSPPFDRVGYTLSRAG
jgi:hypothetical protein